MTKPNELTLAIEKMTRVLEGWEAKETDPNQLVPALRLVIEAAKRPTALSGEEREKLANEYWSTEGRFFDPDFSDVPLEAKLPEHCKHAFVFGLTAALSLASPFTREKLVEHIAADAALLAKLDAMLEDK